MLIKPFGNDLWFKLTQPRKGDCDRVDKYFGVFGEFSPNSDIAFDKHCNRLNRFTYSPFYLKFNGNKIKEIRKQEPLWY